MQQAKSASSAVRMIQKNKDETLEIISSLHDILNSLRYEGKLFLGKNLKEVEKALQFINEEILWRADLEERVLFPFLQTAAPKLESVIHLLKLEHEELRKHLRLLANILKVISKTKSDFRRARMIEQVKEMGTYLVYLLQSHIEAEDENVYKIIEDELRHEEVSELGKRLMKVMV